MLLEIRHLTQYHYAAPVRESVMEMWMQPQKGARQRLISFDLELDPAAQSFSYADAYGNAVYHFDVPQPHERLTILAKSAVETQSSTPLPAGLDMGEWGRLKSEFVQRDCFDFLRPHGFAVETEALRAFMQTHLVDSLKERDPLSAVLALSTTLYGALGYATGVTGPDSPVDEAIEAGNGVCQDFAHIMIAICRSWGVPARYVSGYIYSDRNTHDRSDPGATHAWVEVFLPSLRWVGLDPTNNVPAGERHVTVAVGRDYSDVPPSRGVYKGDADSELSVAVSVRQARSALAEPEFSRLARPTFAGRARLRHDVALFEQQMMQQQ
jgi:transglutaminase-like putative cysteine protease